MINQTCLSILAIKIVIWKQNQLKMINFVEKFENMSNLIKNVSGRQQKKPYLSDLPDPCM